MYPEIKNHNLIELLSLLQKPCPEGEDFAFSYYSEICLEIRQKGNQGIFALWEQVVKADSVLLRAIIDSLSMPEFTLPNVLPLKSSDLFKLINLLKKCLDHEDPLVVMTAIDGLRILGDNSILEQVLRMKNNASPYIRGSVLRYMSKLDPERAYPLLINGLSDKHFIVRENAIDELSDLGKSEAIPYISLLLKDEHSDVRQAASTALEFLAKD